MNEAQTRFNKIDPVHSGTDFYLCLGVQFNKENKIIKIYILPIYKNHKQLIFQ